MLSNTTRFRRSVAGGCLIVAPLLLLIGDLIGACGPTNQNSYLDAIAMNPGANEASIVVSVYGFALMVPAVIGVMHVLRYRSVVLAHIGGALLLVGLISFAFVAGTEFINLVAASPEADRGEMLALNERLGGSLGYNIVNATEILGYVLGHIILGVALGRAKIVPWVVSALIVAGILLRFFGAAWLLTVLLGDLFVAAAFALVGMAVLRQSDLEWERPPSSAGAVVPHPQP